MSAPKVQWRCLLRVINSKKLPKMLSKLSSERNKTIKKNDLIIFNDLHSTTYLINSKKTTSKAQKLKSALIDQTPADC